jgi:nucleoside phosphorylase
VPHGFVRTGSLNSPPKILLNALAKFQANRLTGLSNLSDHLAKFERLPEFSRAKVTADVLFKSEYDHLPGRPTCDECSTEEIFPRLQRSSNETVVHYGTIASGNQVVRDGRTRDTISRQLQGVLCFEMEAAGLMNDLPCLVIRGICDYSDSHKNKQWQSFAAAVAIACAKELLLLVHPIEVRRL